MAEKFEYPKKFEYDVEVPKTAKIEKVEDVQLKEAKNLLKDAADCLQYIRGQNKIMTGNSRLAKTLAKINEYLDNK